MTTTTLSGSGSWTCPAGVQYVDVTLIGGGGGGGAGGQSNIKGGGGGAHGATTSVDKQAVTAGVSYSYSVGAGGDGHAPSGADEVVSGHDGTSSSIFGLSASGGSGGGQASSYTGEAGASPGGGSAGSGSYYGGPWTSGGNGSATSGGGGGGTGSFNGSAPDIKAGNGGSGTITISYTLPTVVFNGVGTGSSDPPAGAKPMTVDWTNDTTSGTTYSWAFPGANTTTSTDEEPADSTYASSGNYDVTLTAYNAYGWSSLTKAGYITVYGVPFNRAVFIMADHHRGR